MIPNSRSQYYTRYQERHVAEYSEAARTYWKNNLDEINACQRSARRRNMNIQTSQ